MTDHDPFALLGVPRRFDLDRAALQSAFLRASARWHPDRETSPARALEAAAHAARINDAHRTLGDDERRADALLRLLGGPTKEQETSLPDGFLVDMMTTREEMESALAAGDPKRRAELQQWAAARRGEFIRVVAMLFDEQSRAPESSRLRAIRVQLNAWRYIERMLEQLDPDHRPVM
jgi:molecular chaperone HscB